MVSMLTVPPVLRFHHLSTFFHIPSPPDDVAFPVTVLVGLSVAFAFQQVLPVASHSSKFRFTTFFLHRKVLLVLGTLFLEHFCLAVCNPLPISSTVGYFLFKLLVKVLSVERKPTA
jgi:hypothetical protein